MYKKMKLKGVARIEPDHLGDPLEAAVERALRDKYEGLWTSLWGPSWPCSERMI